MRPLITVRQQQCCWKRLLMREIISRERQRLRIFFVDYISCRYPATTRPDCQLLTSTDIFQGGAFWAPPFCVRFCGLRQAKRSSSGWKPSPAINRAVLPAGVFFQAQVLLPFTPPAFLRCSRSRRELFRISSSVQSWFLAQKATWIEQWFIESYEAVNGLFLPLSS